MQNWACERTGHCRWYVNDIGLYPYGSGHQVDAAEHASILGASGVIDLPWRLRAQREGNQQSCGVVNMDEVDGREPVTR